MIRASFRIRPDSAEFTVKGHSGAAEAGSDIVCAAVSALTGTLAAALLERGGTGVPVAEGAGMADLVPAGDEDTVGADGAEGVPQDHFHIFIQHGIRYELVFFPMNEEDWKSVLR